MGYAKSAFIAWEQVGDVARTQRLANELGGAVITDPPTTLDELYRYMIDHMTQD